MLTPEGYRSRLAEKQLDEYLKTFSAVCIEGPKYCGKTWTAMSRSESAAFIGNPENNFQTRMMAQLNPSLVLKGGTPRLIDEWQKVPPLWDAVRFEADQDRKKGKFILTGSATPEHKGIMHSGTARIAKIRMETMSLYETGDSTGAVSLKDIFEDKMEAVETGRVSLEQLVFYAVRGGWPGNTETSEKNCGRLAKEYLKTVVGDDMFSVDGIKRDSGKVWALLHSLGRNESSICSVSTLKKDMEAADGEDVSRDSISDYLDIFRRLFIIDDQPSFNINLRSSRRILKAPKRHFSDPSLAAAALGATPEMLFNDLNTFSFLFESLCEHDLKIYAGYNEGNLFHFRDERGLEADAVIEFPDGTWGAFEIKLGAGQIDSAAANLLKLKRIFEKEGTRPPKVLCVICGLTGAAYKREDGIFAVPVTALKP